MLNRITEKESPNQLGFLPLHLGMEGFLFAWNERPRRILSQGLNLRS